MKSIHKKIKNSQLPKGAMFYDFIAYDWGPMTFVL